MLVTYMIVITVSIVFLLNYLFFPLETISIDILSHCRTSRMASYTRP